MVLGLWSFIGLAYLVTRGSVQSFDERAILALRSPIDDSVPRGPEWLALVLLTGVIVIFGLVPGLAIAPVDTATVPILTRMVKP